MFLMSNSDWDKYFGRLTEGKLSEDELMMTSVFDFNKFNDEFYQYQNEIFKHSATLTTFRFPSRKFLKTLPYLKDLADRGQIKVVCVGSSRITFAFADGKALKCALSDAGIAQNKREIESIKKSYGHYMCFPNVYEYDKSKYLFLVTDCCRSIRKGGYKNTL